MTGAPSAGATVRAVPLTDDPQVVIPIATTDGNGNFEMHGALPGEYFLFAAANTTFVPLTAEGLTGFTRVRVEGDSVSGIAIILKRGFDVSGRIETEGRNRDRIDLSRIRVELRRAPDILGMPAVAPTTGNNTPMTNVSAEGSFILRAISPGEYVLAVSSLPEGVYLKSIRWNGQSLMGLPIRIDAPPEDPVVLSLSTEAASANIRAVDERQMPVANSTVVLVPDLPLRERRDRYVVSLADMEGRAVLPGLAPGRYTVLAWDSIEEGRWEDPAFIRSNETRGTTIQVDNNSRESIVVTVIRSTP
jgi:hypothetical protein